MRPARISLRVERLVLHGGPGIEGAALARALRGELRRLLEARGVPACWLERSAMDRLDAGEIFVRPELGPAAFASQLALAVLSTAGAGRGEP